MLWVCPPSTPLPPSSFTPPQPPENILAPLLNHPPSSTLLTPQSLAHSQRTAPFTSARSTPFNYKLCIYQLCWSRWQESQAWGGVDVSCAGFRSALDSRKERRAGEEGVGKGGKGGKGRPRSLTFPLPSTLLLSCHPPTPPDLKTCSTTSFSRAKSCMKRNARPKVRLNAVHDKRMN